MALRQKSLVSSHNFQTLIMCLLLVCCVGVIGQQFYNVNLLSDPTVNPAACGNNETMYVCDPENILNISEGRRTYTLYTVLRILISISIFKFQCNFALIYH